MEKLYAVHYINGFGTPTTRIGATLDKAKEVRNCFESCGCHVQFIEVVMDEERYLALFEKYVDDNETDWLNFGGEPTAETWEELLVHHVSIWINNRYPGWRTLEKRYFEIMNTQTKQAKREECDFTDVIPFIPCDDDEEDEQSEFAFLPDDYD